MYKNKIISVIIVIFILSSLSDALPRALISEENQNPNKVSPTVDKEKQSPQSKPVESQPNSSASKNGEGVAESKGSQNSNRVEEQNVSKDTSSNEVTNDKKDNGNNGKKEIDGKSESKGSNEEKDDEKKENIDPSKNVVTGKINESKVNNDTTKGEEISKKNDETKESNSSSQQNTKKKDELKENNNPLKSQENGQNNEAPKASNNPPNSLENDKKNDESKESNDSLRNGENGKKDEESKGINGQEKNSKNDDEEKESIGPLKNEENGQSTDDGNKESKDDGNNSGGKKESKDVGKKDDGKQDVKVPIEGKNHLDKFLLDTCDVYLQKCQEHELVACLQRSDIDSKILDITVQNSGDDPLNVTIAVQSSVTIDSTMLNVGKHSSQKVNISSYDTKSLKIVLNAGKGDCIIQIGIGPSISDWFQQFPIYASQVTPIYGAYFLFITLIIVGVVWVSCKFRKRGRRVDNGVQYQQLEMGTQMQSNSEIVEASTVDGWNQGWDDDWDEEEEISRPSNSNPDGKFLSNGLSSRSARKENDWDVDWDD